jgi:hypothetical protein
MEQRDRAEGTIFLHVDYYRTCTWVGIAKARAQCMVELLTFHYTLALHIRLYVDLVALAELEPMAPDIDTRMARTDLSARIPVDNQG